MKSAIKAVLQLPGLVQLRRARYERKFRSPAMGHGFRGVYDSFAAALRSAPEPQRVGYDNENAAAMYVGRPVFPEDYAVLFWLSRLLRENARVLDYGGHAGSAFDAWSALLPLPAGTAWTVHDVPAVVEAGRRRNAQRTGVLPSFTTDFGAASGVDVLVASGSLQYVEQPLHERLAALAEKPRHLLINQLPVHPRDQFVTLQNIATCYCPYVIFHEGRFFDGLRSLGYRVVDTWTNPGKGCWIPTYPKHTAAPYRGALLARGDG